MPASTSPGAAGSQAMQLFRDPQRVPFSDVQLIFRDGTLHTHKLVVSATFGLIRGLIDTEPESRSLDLCQCPPEVSCEAAGILLCHMYTEAQLPGVQAVRDVWVGLSMLEPTAQFLDATLACKAALNGWKQCRCCMRYIGHQAPLVDNRLCERCWERAGNVLVHIWDGMSLLPCAGALTYDHVWQAGRKPTPDHLVRALCAALRASPTKTCIVFRDMLLQHLPDPAYRLTTAQAGLVQDALGAAWCNDAQVHVHHLMALPAQYQPRNGCSWVHCYYGSDGHDLKAALQASSGIGPPLRFHHCSCGCRPRPAPTMAELLGQQG